MSKKGPKKLMKTSVYGWQKPTTPACKPLVSSVKHPKWHTIARWAFLELYFDQSLSCSNLTQLPTSRSSTPNQQEPPQPAARLPHPTALELVLCMFASPPPRRQSSENFFPPAPWTQVKYKLVAHYSEKYTGSDSKPYTSLWITFYWRLSV